MNLRERYLEARAAGATRHRDIAHSLGVSEGQLIDAHVGAPTPGLHARRLRRDFPALIARLGRVGEVMALTRNAHCVHERTGVYEQVSAKGAPGREVGLALGPEIDLRIFYSQWAHGYAVRETSGASESLSLQFFDAHGVAVHKVFTRPATQMAAWQALCLDCEDEHAEAPAWDASARPLPQEAAGVDQAAFRSDWGAMRDTHDFFGLLQRHGLRRIRAMHLAAPEYAQSVDVSSARAVLEGAAASSTPIMVFVGNPGVIQIHGGPIQRVAVMGPWLNVLDRRFNLHLREDAVHSAWAVRKPTVDGAITSLELYDAEGELIVQFFGQRKPGQPERCAWRQLIDTQVDSAAWSREAVGCAA